MAEASQALFTHSQGLSGKGLLFADEGFQASVVPVLDDLTMITNRLDIVTDFNESGVRVELSDFDVNDIENHSLDYILVRIPKSRRLSNYFVNQAARLLRVGGRLIVTGNNQEGIKSVIKNAGKQLGEIKQLELLGKGLRYAEICLLSEDRWNAEDEYQEISEITLSDDIGTMILFTKPGIYGFNKIDQGSEFLIEVLKKHLLLEPVLDLGCGYGYLSVTVARQHQLSTIMATDNNITAVELCQKNLSENMLEGEVFIDDCAAKLKDRSIGTIICNPPFHQGFSTSSGLTKKFIEATKRLLLRKGKAYYVVNRFIAIEPVCDDIGIKYGIIAQNNQFKVLEIYL